jgi:L-rhamnose mutarotase
VAWSTRLVAGREEDYTRLHREIPEKVADALRAAGVVDWRIWRDGSVLFHAVETRDGHERMLRRMAEFGPIDEEWDAEIATMIQSQDEAPRTLPLVWHLSATGQGPGC